MTTTPYQVGDPAARNVRINTQTDRIWLTYCMGDECRHFRCFGTKDEAIAEGKMWLSGEWQ